MKLISTFILFAIAGLFFYSCDSDSNSNETETSIIELHKQIVEDKDGALATFFLMLDDFEKKSMLQVRKTEKIDGNSKSIKLDFEKDQVIQIIQIPRKYGTRAIKSIIFGSQLSIYQLKEIIENPVDSFYPKTNESARVKTLNRINNDVVAFINSAKYIMVMIPKITTYPSWYGTTYEPGKFDAKALIYDLSNSEIIANLDIKAISSTGVSSKNFKDLGEAIKADYLKNINLAIKEKLEENFDVKGNPFGLMFFTMK